MSVQDSEKSISNNENNPSQMTYVPPSFGGNNMVQPDNNIKECMAPRQIVGIGFVPSIKNLFLGDESDEDIALNKIAKKCVNDFVLKCTKILEDCTEIPSTAYTYIIFLERFGWLQQKDSTTKQDTKNIIAQSKAEYLASKILDLYKAKYEIFDDNENIRDYIHASLLDEDRREKNIEILTNMFGKDLFPNISIWYNFNDDENKWQYVYCISAPEGSLAQKQ